MRSIRVWVENEAESSAEERVKLWAKLESRAQDLYGDDLRLPEAASFSGANAAAFIKNLLAWLESQAEKGDDEKKSLFQSLFNR